MSTGTREEKTWRRRRWGICILLTIVAMGFIGRKAFLRHRFLQAVRDDRSRVTDAQGKAASIMLAIEGSVGLSEEETKTRVGLNHPFIVELENASDHYRQVSFYDSPSQYTFHLAFIDGKLRRYSWKLFGWQPPDAKMLAAFGEWACDAAIATGVIWWIVFAQALGLWRFRKDFGDILVAIALLFSPNSAVVIQIFFSLGGKLRCRIRVAERTPRS